MSYNSNQWQSKLAEACRNNQMRLPEYQIFTEQRGSRTAWSCFVLVNGQPIKGRYFFDGKNVDNAKEDAAEVALIHLNSTINTSSPSSATSQDSIW